MWNYLLNNVDFIMRANTCYNCGQSGVQTAQSGGICFTASVGVQFPEH